jgi:hypothetical protein
MARLAAYLLARKPGIRAIWTLNLASIGKRARTSQPDNDNNEMSTNGLVFRSSIRPTNRIST